ncbi:MAG: Zn-ribbon domain-containing OB-fold protein [Anaerolineae bacterium]|nr:Zn-ribbon domain-containing OB-fold protein [Anaerolineae bacterium]
MKEHVYDTVYLRGKDFEEGNVLFETWDPNARYAWDTGVGMSRFLQELKAGRLVGAQCSGCCRVMVPPRMFCEHCFLPTDAFVPLQDTGTIVTFSLCYVTWDMIRIKEPQIPIVVAIDGASPGMGIMHLLGEIEPDAVKIGMRVQAVWKPAEERTASITDIAYFKPLEQGGSQ